MLHRVSVFIILLHRLSILSSFSTNYLFLSSSSTEYLFYHPAPHTICIIILLLHVSVLSSSSIEYLFCHPPPPSIYFIILLHSVSVLSFSSEELQDCPPPPPILQQVEHVKVIITSSGQPLLITPVDQKLRDLKTLKQHYYPEVPWPQSHSSIIP